MTEPICWYRWSTPDDPYVPGDHYCARTDLHVEHKCCCGATTPVEHGTPPASGDDG